MSRKTIFILICTGLAVLCPLGGDLTAQVAKTDTQTYISPFEVLITAPRMSVLLKENPAATALVERDLLKKMPRGVGVDEALRLVPGVKIDNQANGSRVHMSMRGQGILTESGIRGINILLDEIPLNDPTGFAPDFFDIDFSTVERIEVLRGAAASLYGGSASGGIVNVVTQNAPGIPLYGEASASAGSNNFWKGLGQFGGQVDNWNYRASFSRTMGDGYRQHTHFWGNNGYAKATWTPSDRVRLTPIFGYTDFYHENPEGLSRAQYQQDPKLPNDDAIPFNEYLEANRVTNGLTGTVVLADDHFLAFSGYVKRTLFTEANNKQFNHRTISTPGANIQYTFRYGKTDDALRNTFNVGTDLRWQTVDEHRVANFHAVEGDSLLSKEQIRQNGLGIYALDKVDIGKDWGLMLSLRSDRINNELDDLLNPDSVNLSGNADFSRVTGRVGLTFCPMQEMNFFASWGQGFLPPATEELAQNPDRVGGFNTHLTFATSNGYDLGVRGAYGEQVYYDLTGFYLATENDFDRYRVPGMGQGGQGTFYRNAGSSHRFGLEMFVKYVPVRDVGIQLAYTFSDFKYANTSQIRIMMDDTSIYKYIKNGNRLPNSPQHQIALDLGYNVTKDLELGLGAEVFSKSYIDGANIEAEAVDGYALFDARIAYGLLFEGMKCELSLSARNLADTKYVAFSEPDPGGNAYQPGAGREFFGGLKVRF